MGFPLPISAVSGREPAPARNLATEAGRLMKDRKRCFARSKIYSHTQIYNHMLFSRLPISGVSGREPAPARNLATEAGRLMKDSKR